jgi:hypothetical protein
MSNFGLFSYVVVDPYHTPRLFVGEEQYITFVELCQPPPLICGDEGTRTPDLLRAREALSHLSYIPVRVGLTRLELVTFPLSEGCSNRLSYRPKKDSLRQIALQEPIYH